MKALISSVELMLLLLTGIPVAYGSGDCSDFTDLSGDPLPIKVFGSTQDATNNYGPFDVEPDCWQGSWDPFCAMAPDVTFMWTAPESGQYSFSLVGSFNHAELLIYDFTCPDEPVYPEDFICGSHRNLDNHGFLSNLWLAAGQEILIVVDGWGQNSGDFELSIHDTRDLDHYIVMFMDLFHLPGLSAAVVKDGRICWTRALGMANIEEEREVTDSTVFLLASISKSFTGTALMQLYDEGLFGLDDGINAYLPFEIHHPLFPETPITFRMLLSHVAGISDNASMLNTMAVCDMNSPITLAQLVEGYFTPGGEYYNASVNFTDDAPGTGYYYTNFGVCLVAYLAECIASQVTPTTFVEYCQENLFDSLEMYDTSWMLEILDPDYLAMPYQYWSAGQYYPLCNFHAPWYPASMLRSNAARMSRFLIAFMQGGEIDGVRILEEETVELMLTDHYPDIHPGLQERGFLWHTVEIGGRHVWGHDGAMAGVRSQMFFSPEENIGVVVITNISGQNGVPQITEALFDFAAREVCPVVVEADRPAGTPVLLSNCFPNPFNPITAVSFYIDRTQHVAISVFDMTGRRIAVIADQSYGIGSHTVEWKGKDASGRSVSSGTYIVRMKTEDRVEARKVMLLR